MEEQFNNLITKIRNEKMTENEKAAIWFRVETFAKNNPVGSSKLVKYPYFSAHHFFTAGKVFATSILLVVFGFGGLSYSSASSLPGDLLYSIKINVNEKIEEKLTFTPEKKINLRKKRIETRLTEVESLIKENKVTKKNREIVEKNIKVEKEKIESELKQIQEQNPEIAVAAKAEIENSIKDHQEKIDSLMQEKIDSEVTDDPTIDSETSVNTTENTENEATTNSPAISNETENLNSAEITENQTPIQATQETQQNTATETTAVTQEAATVGVEAKKEVKNQETLLLINSLKTITAISDTTLSSDKIDSESADTQESE
ncbi:MAG TPA: hypothetical protein PLO44_02020 [Candidatus Paceibacterota bacterium]|nr:hypothetical protein [Candidatus Paceibacterota bacterium]